MGNDFKTALRPALSFLLLLTIITGLLYPLLILGLGQAIFPGQANGSIVRDGDRVVGSALIGQGFAAPNYFHSRPSAAGDGYDAAASSGSNLGPTSKALADTIGERIGELRADGLSGPAPADLVTASGSGLDPHISPAAARVQIRRVAEARGIAPDRLQAMVERAIEYPTFGVLGEARVNVLLLNRDLDRATGNRQRDAIGANSGP